LANGSAVPPMDPVMRLLANQRRVLASKTSPKRGTA
jgi:hypothetical protein